MPGEHDEGSTETGSRPLVYELSEDAVAEQLSVLHRRQAEIAADRSSLWAERRQLELARKRLAEQESALNTARAEFEAAQEVRQIFSEEDPVNTGMPPNRGGTPNWRSFPVSIYLEQADPSTVRSVVAAVSEVLATANFQLVPESDPVIGSWWQRFRAKLATPEAREGLQDRIDKLERAAESKLLSLPESQANLNNAQSLATILLALKDEPTAVIQVGSLLIVKVTSRKGETTTYSKTLTASQLKVFERRPEILKDPHGLLRHLSLSEGQLARPESEGAAEDESSVIPLKSDSSGANRNPYLIRTVLDQPE